MPEVCGVDGYWRLADCGTCFLPAGHEGLHEDGQGYTWDEGQWAWQGPVIDLADLYDPDAEAVFREG